MSLPSEVTDVSDAWTCRSALSSRHRGVSGSTAPAACSRRRALCSILTAVQSTNNLVIDVEGRKNFFGRKKPLVFPFSKLSLSRKYPQVTHAELSEVADRIMQLVIPAKSPCSLDKARDQERRSA